MGYKIPTWEMFVIVRRPHSNRFGCQALVSVLDRQCSLYRFSLFFILLMSSVTCANTTVCF